MADTQQFDGQNPVSGYTLFQGKDGKSFYLKGENLADEEIKSRVAKLRGQNTAAPDISSESQIAAHPPTPKPMAMQQTDHPQAISAARQVLNPLQPPLGGGNSRYWFTKDNGQQPGQPFSLDRYVDSPQGRAAEESNVNTAKFGTDVIGTGEIARAGARLAETQVLPALKAVPYAGKLITAVDEAPGVAGKVVRGATVGGVLGGGEGLLRGHGANSLEDAAKGAVAGGVMGAVLPAIHKLSGYEPPAEPELGSPENPGYMSKLPTRLPPNLRGDPFAPPEVPAPEPELGSPENPGFMSKLPSRLPQGLRGDPFSPRPASVSEALRQAAPDDVAVVPDERPAVVGDRPGSAWSLTRTEGLPEAAQRGQPGAINVLRQLKPTVVTPRSGGFDSPNMQALRESLGITESVPQGNPTPYSPPAPAPEATDSAFAPWFKPRRTPVLQ